MDLRNSAAFMLGMAAGRQQLMDHIYHQYEKAYAGGTVSEGWFDADGHRYVPIRPGDMAWEMKKAFEPLLQKMIENPNYFAVNAMIEHGKQMEKVVNQLNTANIVTNNKQQQSIVNNNEFNITLPNVTNL